MSCVHYAVNLIKIVRQIFSRHKFDIYCIIIVPNVSHQFYFKHSFRGDGSLQSAAGTDTPEFSWNSYSLFGLQLYYKQTLARSFSGNFQST